MRIQVLVLVLAVVIAFAFGGLVQSQNQQATNASHPVEVGKTYQAQWSGSASIEFKVTEIIDGCWVKIEKSRKSYDFTCLNICSAMGLRSL